MYRTALSPLSFATRVTAEFAQFTENSTKDKSSDILYVYKYCYIFSQVKSTIEIFLLCCHWDTNRVDRDELDI